MIYIKVCKVVCKPFAVGYSFSEQLRNTAPYVQVSTLGVL